MKKRSYRGRPSQNSSSASNAKKRQPQRRRPIRQLELQLNPFDEHAAIREPETRYRTHSTRGLDSHLQRVLVRAEFVQPLRGKHVVLCGRMKRITNEQMIEATNRSGGRLQQGIDETTNVVVLGSDAGGSPELDPLTENHSIDLMSETEFLGLLGLNDA